MLDSHPGSRVGLAWAGNPKHLNDRRRSIPASQFLEIANVPEVGFYSLQHQVREGDRTALGTNSTIVQVGEMVDEFAAIAAIIKSLDLVITVDTAIAHLASALGKPVCVLLAFVADWRWLVGRDDSSWYPTARLFRQERAGEWSPVIKTGESGAAQLCSRGTTVIVVIEYDRFKLDALMLYGGEMIASFPPFRGNYGSIPLFHDEPSS